MQRLARLTVCVFGAVAAVPSLTAAQQPDSTRDTVQLKPVVVVGQPVERSSVRALRSATHTERLLRDVPQAVTAVHDALIADQAMLSMGDAVRFMPGIGMGQGEGHRDAPTIRGNSSTADFFVDGMRDDAQYYRDFYNVERVEALRGANALAFGRGGGGGVINRVTKVAEVGAPGRRQLTLAGGAYEHKRTAIDLGQAFTGTLAGRLAGMLESSAQFRDRTEIERFGLNPTLAYRGAGGTSLTASFERFTDRRTVNRGIPSAAGRPSAAPIDVFFGDPDRSRSHMHVHAFDATLSHPWSAAVQLRNRTRVASYDKFYENVYPGGAVNAAGTSVNLAAYNQDLDRTNLFNQTDLTFKVGKGALRQTLLLGGEIGRQGSRTLRQTGYFNDSLTYAVPFAAPTVRAPVTFRQSPNDADSETTLWFGALYLQDEIMMGTRWQAVLGLRYDRFALDFQNNRNNQILGRTDNVFSPRAGLVFKPAEPVSVYGSYSVSFLPSSGDQFGALSVTTATLEPERFENKEIGLKWELRRELLLTAAYYVLDRTNTQAPDPADPARIVQTGSQRSRGVEIGLTGAVTDRWVIAGAFASQRAEITSRTQAAAEGQRVPLVPATTFSLWNRLTFTGWLGAGVGVLHATDMFAAIDNAVTLPGFTRVDVAAFLTVSRRVDLQINVENLLNEAYYPTSHGNNNIMPGAPRSVRVSMHAAL